MQQKFLLYANACRPSLKEANPEMTIAQLTSRLGESWRKLSAKEKAPYQKEAEARRAQYIKEKTTYDNWKRENAPPKRPQKAFLLYSSARRPQLQKRMPDATFANVARVLGQEWQSMGEGKKAQFVVKATSLREKYLQEKEAWDSARASGW